MKPKVYKAQWPLGGTENLVLIYEADDRESKWHYLEATPEVREQLFADGKYIRVLFLGTVDGKNVNVAKFVRKGEWL